MNTANDINQTPTVTMSQTAEKVSSTDLEPIPFCPEEITRSHQTNVLPKTELTINTQMVSMIRIPCRARGVCETHTPSSAYFEIPEDCQHGKLLSCSHELCRDSGRRFRYCKECDQVTAKRNFTKRHAHGITNTMRLSPIEVARADSRISSTCKKRKVSVDADNESTLASRLMNAMSTGDDDGISDTSESVPSTVYANKTENTMDKLSGSILRMVTPKEAGILELLCRRPTTDDRLAMSQWIQDILDVTSNDTTNQVMMAEDIILTDDEDDELLLLEPPMRMQSLDNFDVFTESFENLLMK
jgi:hypothetical protein